MCEHKSAPGCVKCCTILSRVSTTIKMPISSIPTGISPFFLLQPSPSSSCLLYPHSQPLATTLLFSISIILPFQECHIDGMIEYITFGIDFFFTVSIIPLRFIQVAVCIYSSFYCLVVSHGMDIYCSLTLHLLKGIRIIPNF